VREKLGDGRKECQATVVGTVGEIPRLRHRDKNSLPPAARDALAVMYEVTEKQQELFAVRTTVFEQFGRDTVGSWSLVIGHEKKSLVDFFQRESRTQCGIIFFGVLAEAVHRGSTAFALCSF
jgi:hypothetical protein